MTHRSFNADYDSSCPQYEHSQGTCDSHMTYSEPSHLMKNRVRFKRNSLQQSISPRISEIDFDEEPQEGEQTCIAVNSEEDTSSIIMTRSKSKKQSRFKKKSLNKDVDKDNCHNGRANEMTISSDSIKLEELPSMNTLDAPVPEVNTVPTNAIPPVAVVEPIPSPVYNEITMTTETNGASCVAEPVLKSSKKSGKSHLQLRKWRVIFVKKDVTILEGYKE